MKDIEHHDDVALLIKTFYTQVLKDDTIGHFFTHIDFDAHLPQMIHFWEFVLLDKPGYTTDVTKKHLNMPLEQQHFDQWLKLFHTTTDQLFKGPIADKAKQRATLIGWTIKSKMGND